MNSNLRIKNNKNLHEKPVVKNLNNINQSVYLSNFKFNKNFGQNFLRDKNLLNAIVKDSKVTFDDEVLEIGTGAGALTEIIAKNCKNVVSYEIDKKLTEFLDEKFKNIKNVKIIIKDALKEPIENIEKLFNNNYFIIANLPYYITSPLIFKFIEQTCRAKVITIMVQKEFAEKAVAKPSSSNYGILSVMLQHYCKVNITRIVKKEMFNPRPKVDSAVLRLERKPINIGNWNEIANNIEIGGEYNKKFSKFIYSSFAMKRKTLVNNLVKYGLEKKKIEDVLNYFNIPLNTRAENLSLQQFRQLFVKLDIII